MDLEPLTKLAITASVLLLVFALGLRVTIGEATYLFRRPATFARALLAMYVIVPAVAVLLAWMFKLHRAVEIALLAMAVAPVPPILPNTRLKLGGRAKYVYGLLIAMSHSAIVIVPLALEILGWVFRLDTHINAVEVAKQYTNHAEKCLRNDPTHKLAKHCTVDQRKPPEWVLIQSRASWLVCRMYSISPTSRRIRAFSMKSDTTW